MSVTRADNKKEHQRRYNASAKGRASRAKYAQTERGREAQRKAKANWNAANVAVVRAASRARFERMIAQVNAIKIAAGCTDCGFAGHPSALDFDHIDPATKVANVSSLIRRRPWIQVAAEIAKCEVVCANCHRIRTYLRAQP